MKTYSVRISVRAENEDDLIERLQDGDLVDNFIEQSIELTEEN